MAFGAFSSHLAGTCSNNNRITAEPFAYLEHEESHESSRAKAIPHILWCGIEDIANKICLASLPCSALGMLFNGLH